MKGGGERLRQIATPARIEDLGPGDLVKMECAACGHETVTRLARLCSRLAIVRVDVQFAAKVIPLHAIWVRLPPPVSPVAWLHPMLMRIAVWAWIPPCTTAAA